MGIYIHISAALTVFCLSFISPLFGQDLAINEFMSANDSSLQDRYGDYPDWIELYNPNNYPLNLANYGISDDVNNTRKWLFPELSIPARGYLLIFASGKNLLDPEELHTAFKISSEGETLILTNHGGAVIDIIDPADLASDVSLARIPDGGDRWVQSNIPTPGGPNEAENQLYFSAPQGFYKAPLYLDINSLSGDPIRYTTDGSLPSPDSKMLSGNIILDYMDNLPNIFSEIPTSPEQSQISYHAWSLPGKPVDKAHVIRCASFREGIRTSPVYTRTYFVDVHIIEKFSLPVFSLVTDSLNLFDGDSGIYLPGNFFDSAEPSETGNYFQKGKQWERNVHLEYFSINGDIWLSQDAGFRIHGGLTRHAAQKTLRIYAREEYGKEKFRHQLLPQKKVNVYKRFLLRTTMGSKMGKAIVSDILAHELVRNLDFEIMDYQPVIVYINGEYWGIHTLRDRVDEHYIEYTCGIDKDSVDIINANIGLVDAGSNGHYMELAGFIGSNDLSVHNNYEYVKTQIDISSFVDYIVAEMFFANSDWPGNNQKLWRPQTPDGKWRWIFMDLDAAYNPEASYIFSNAMIEEGEMEWSREPVSSFLLRNLLKNDQFTSYFIDRFAEILNKELTTENVYRKLEEIKSLYEEELPRHISRWGYPFTLSGWQKDMEDHLMRFLKIRPCEVAGQVIRYFDLDDFGFSCGSGEGFDENLVVAPNPSDGHFFIWNTSTKSVLCNLVLSDISGRVVFTENNIVLEKLEKKQFDLSRLSGGMYYLSVNSSGQHTVKPLVIY